MRKTFTELAAVTACVLSLSVPALAVEPITDSVIAGIVADRVTANIKRAKNEKTVFAKALMAGPGISVKGIQDHGILGGSCSLLRKPLGC